MLRDILVQDWMSPKVVSVSPDTPITEAHTIMKDNNIRRLAVIDKGQLVGIVTIGDVREAAPSQATTLSIWELNYLWSQIRIKEVMSKTVYTVGADEPMINAAQIMLDHRDDLFKDFAVADDYPDQDVDDENETNPFLHVTIHSIVEDQLAEKDPIEVVQFYNAMRKKQCTHHDTVHLIAAIFVPLMFGNMTEQESFDIDTYRVLLNKYKTRNPEKIMDLLENEKILFPDEA